MNKKCKCESWTLRGLTSALRNKMNANNRIVVPMFQRGKRWDSARKRSFIDSLENGYPVGSMLFYEKKENNQSVYILVDGLQRSSCICEYIEHPTKYLSDDSISMNVGMEILDAMGCELEENSAAKIREDLISFIKQQEKIHIQFYHIAYEIVKEYCENYDIVGRIVNIIEEAFEEWKEQFETIATTEIPVLIYSGEEGNLPEIFDRINSQGVPLNPYEIYAASWPLNEKIVIENKDIIESVVKKYDSLEKDGISVAGYNREQLRTSRSVTAFEYLFGLSRYLANKYEMLNFKENLTDNEVDHLAFELANACMNDSNKMSSLHKHFINSDNVNQFEKALINTIDFVEKSLKTITSFKGNTRKKSRILHAKYQILSMIATTFKEMYESTDYTKTKESWDAEKRKIIERNLLHYYIYDIIQQKEWKEGGNSKIFKFARPNRYLTDITYKMWSTVIDEYFERTMQRTESTRPRRIENEEYVILNCIYMHTFTAKDQLSSDAFDIEHIAPKKQMLKLIKACKCKDNNRGLPISTIANLCYLPAYVNRSKRDKNFYQDKKYLSKINLQEIEEKYSFTQKKDLEWMDLPYDKEEDFFDLRDCYTDFCRNRFEKLRHLLFKSLGIEYTEEEKAKEDNTLSEIILPSQIESINYHDFVLKTASDVDARMRYYPTEKRFVILAGSKVRLNESEYLHNQTISRLREEVFADDEKSCIEDDSVVLLKDITIPRPLPSPAASFCTGTAMQGTIAWKDASDESRTFEDIYPK